MTSTDPLICTCVRGSGDFATRVTPLRYLTFGHNWLILSTMLDHGHHNPERETQVAGPPGLGFVLVVPTANLDATYALWLDEALPITLEPEDVGWARIFYGLDPDGYEVMFE